MSLCSRSANIAKDESVSLKISNCKIDDNLPNIYYIILDAYSSLDVLKKYYGYNSDAFLKYLKQKGFYVAENSKCNYPVTMLSLRSSLNMEYIPIGHQKLTNVNFVHLLVEKIRNNKVAKILAEKNYKYFPIGHCFFSNCLFNVKNTNISFKYLPTENLWIDELALTPFERICGRLGNFNNDHFRSDILLAFDQLEKSSKCIEKKFVLAHILSPHPPYVFNKDGTPTENVMLNIPPTMTKHEYVNVQRKNYIAQLEFVTKKISNSIDQIIKNDSSAVIILQSDHGGWVADTLDQNHDYARDTSFIAQRMPILNAYRVPGKIYAQLYDSISPVNTFRLILNGIFNQNEPLLPDNHLVIYGKNREGEKIPD
jgi:hypothetical protein